MTAIALSALETRIRARAACEYTQAVSQSEIDAHSNSSLADLYETITIADGHEIFATSATFVVGAGDVAGTWSPSTPTIRAVLAVILILPTASAMAIEPIEQTERDRRWYGYLPRTGFGIRYRLEGQSLYFEPPSAALGLSGKLRYIPAFVPLVRTPTPTTLDLPSGVEEFVVCDVAAKIRTKQRQDASELYAERERWRQIAVEVVETRNMGGAVRPARRHRW